MDRTLLFDIIYALAARDGRDQALFGDSMPAARQAFERSLAGHGFPELWFEVPLLGKPWFDLHALASPDHFDENTVFSPETCGFCPGAFEWFACQTDGVRQLALSWDTGAGDTEHPAVQLLVSGRYPEVTCAFLESAGRADATGAYRSFYDRLPEDWYPCYTGVFPRRSTPFLRVECIPVNGLQAAYAADPALLEEHLAQVGYTDWGDTLIERCQLLANTPFALEFQCDVTPEGLAKGTFSASVRFAQPPGEDGRDAFSKDGAAGELMRQVQAWGLSDERWRLLADTLFAKRIEFGGQGCLLYCYPAFLKLRWREGVPVDAKAYLIAGAQ